MEKSSGYRALQIQESNPSASTQAPVYQTELITKPFESLPAGWVRVAVEYSALNYKDALSASGNRGVTRHFPHTPGIDAAGTVCESSCADLKPGSKVIVTGYDLGMNTNGGLAEYVDVPQEWLVSLPEGMDSKRAMCLGTAGLTAAIAVDKIIHNGLAKDATVIVSGASGGVGSWAIALFLHLGFTVIAVSSKAELVGHYGSPKLTCIRPDQLLAFAKGPIGKPLWQAGLDTVGGEVLTAMLKSCAYSGSIAACGMAASTLFESSVFPFILKGVNLLGVDSVEMPVEQKQRLWNRLATTWQAQLPDSLIKEVDLPEASGYLQKFLQGRVKGRILVNVNDNR